MLHITLAENRTTFSPGEQIAGTARWQLDEAPESIEINLGWSTRGKGTVDTEAIETTTVANPMAGGEHPFRFTAPGEPCSFSGKLISLIWSVEVLVGDGDESERAEIVIAPGGQEIELPTVETPGPLPQQAGNFLQKLMGRKPQV